jgi:hypothetical protein
MQSRAAGQLERLRPGALEPAVLTVERTMT